MERTKCIWYKLIVAMCIVVTFCSFIASTPVHASKVNTSDFYYSGTQKGSYTVDKSFIDIIIDSLGAILDYLLGLCTLGIRMVFIGWTALFERCLTWIFKGATGEEVAVDEVSSTNLIGSDDWITLDAIFFNHVPLLDVNFFKFELIEGYDATGTEIQGENENHNAPIIIYTENNVVKGEKKDFLLPIHQPEPVEFSGEEGSSTGNTDDDSLVIILKKAIAGWYYTFRLISIMIMLILLVYIGIQLAIKSSTTDKAVYKQMLTDWVVGMILVFSIHYIMLAIIQFNEIVVDVVSGLRTGATPLAVYEYGLEERAKEPITNEELEFTLYDEVKTRSYDIKMTVGMTGMIMYMVLVFYAWKFTFIYLKRYLTVAVLVIMAPLVAVFYAYNKVKTGKAQIFTNWLKEFFFIVMLQSIHAIIYVMFVQTALGMSLGSISGFILVLLLFNFISKAESIFRKIFNINGKVLGGVTEGGIRDTVNNLKGAMTTMAVGKLAKNYTKGAAKLMTKPLTAAATFGFGEHMKHKAKKLDEKAKQYGIEMGNGVSDYTDMKKALRNKRTNALKFGNIINQLENGDINVDELQESINALNVGDSLYDENGSMIGVVDAKYIKGKQAELDEIVAISNLTDAQKNDWMDEYNKLHTKKGKLKKFRIYAGDKWADIMDPTKYVEQIKDKDGNYKYQKIKKTKVNGKVDSIGTRLAKQLTWDNISGLNKEEKAALKAQKELIKNQIFGFAGLLAGLPLAVTEPAIGMPLLAVGINNSSKILSNEGKKKEKTLRSYKMDATGKYTFKGFEGKSEHTIAEGAKAMARDQVQEIVDAKEIQEASMKARMEAKHKKLSLSLKVAANTGKALQFGTIGTLGMVGGAPAVVAAAGAAGAVKLNGSILSRIGDNAWTRYQASIRAANKADAKALEKSEKNAGTADYLNIFANQYLELEHKEYQGDSVKHAEKFGEQYAIVLSTMQSEIDKKTDAEILRDSGYEDAIVVDRKKKTTKISIDAENTLIDNVLIDYAIQSGVMDVSKISIDEKKEHLIAMLKTDMIARGIIATNEDVDKVFEDVTKKLKDRQVQFKDEDKGKRRVQDKVAGNAIISIMQEKGITAPEEVSDDDILIRYNQLMSYAKPSEQSSGVVDTLNQQRENKSANTQIVDSILAETNARTVIQSRKAIFAEKSKKQITEADSKALRNALKTKQEIKIDQQILEKQETLENLSTDVVFNEIGGANPNNDGGQEVTDTDSVLKMLSLQTQLHQDKKKMEYVQIRRNSGREEKVKAYQQMQSDGGQRVFANQFQDGSRRVAPTYDKSIDITEILKKKKQELKG